jgi:putative oxidoreductase
MKKLFSSEYSSNNISMALLVLRVGIGVLMLIHGVPKMAGLFSDGPVQFPSVLGMTPEISLSLAVFAEVICSVLLIVGFGTRLATIPLIITMLVAVLYIHGNDPFANQEIGIHYLLAYVLLLITGAGKYSLDNLLTNNKISATQRVPAYNS